MKKDNVLICLYARSWGRDRFYPENDLAERFAELVNQRSFTVDQLYKIKSFGFDIVFLGSTWEFPDD